MKAVRVPLVGSVAIVLRLGRVLGEFAKPCGPDGINARRANNTRKTIANGRIKQTSLGLISAHFLGDSN